LEFNDLKKIGVEIYSGKSKFSMHYGSYTYRDLAYSKVKLTSKVISEDENYFILSLSDDRDNNKGSLTAMKVGDKIKIKVQLADSEYNRIVLSLPSYKEEHFYGCGATYTKFDLKGEFVRIWVDEHQNSSVVSRKAIREKIYGATPDCIEKFNKYASYFSNPICISSDKYFIYVNTSNYMEFDFRNDSSTLLRIHGNAEVTIGMAQSFEKISGMISEMIGKPKHIPDWVYDGIILGVQRGVDEYKRKLQRIEKYNMPVSAVYCKDWSGFVNTEYGYHVKCNWEADSKLYPNLKGEIVELHEKGIKFIGYINPFVINESQMYKEGTAKGYFVKNRRGKDYLAKIISFSVALVDLTNPDARKWFKEKIKKNMIGIGMDGFCADYGDYLPPNLTLYDGSNSTKIHNKWPGLWASLIREAIEETGRQRDLFVFTRSAFMDSLHNISMLTTGSHHVDFSYDYGLPSVIPAMLSMSVSGALLSHSEIGGQIDNFRMSRTDENLMRWAEMAAFSPVMHTEEGNHPIRNYQFDDEENIREHIAKMVRIHVQLGDYLKLLEKEAVDKGLPVIRPLFYYYDEERAYTESYEYLLGRDILVAPIIKEEATDRVVYLPKDTWIQLFTGLVFEGGFITVRSPLGRPPVFIRASSPYRSELMEMEKV